MSSGEGKDEEERHREALERYRRLLERGPDIATRRVLEHLIEDAESRLEALLGVKR